MKADVKEVQRPVKHLIPTHSSSVGAKQGIKGYCKKPEQTIKQNKPKRKRSVIGLSITEGCKRGGNSVDHVSTNMFGCLVKVGKDFGHPKELFDWNKGSHPGKNLVWAP